MSDLVGGFETIPVNACDADRVSTGVNDLISAGVPIPGALGKGRTGDTHDKDGSKENNLGRESAGKEPGTHLHSPWSDSCELKDRTAMRSSSQPKLLLPYSEEGLWE